MKKEIKLSDKKEDYVYRRGKDCFRLGENK